MSTKPKTVSAAQWGGTEKDPGLKRHYVTLPSGAVVGLEIPDLPTLIASGQLPNHLTEFAIKAAKGIARGDEDSLTEEALKKQPEFYKYIIQEAMKEPVVDDKLYEKLPTEDKEMIVAIATRQIDMDAEYKHIGGLHTSARWRSFRGVLDLDSDVEGAEGG